MERKLMLLLTYLLVSVGLLTAQISRVTGVVKSAEDDLPIIGATVLVEGTGLGTVTDMDGKFEISNNVVNSNAANIKVKAKSTTPVGNYIIQIKYNGCLAEANIVEYKEKNFFYKNNQLNSFKHIQNTKYF